MEEAVSVKHEGKNMDIKQEKHDNIDSFKYEFDSGSQDSSKSGSGGYQRWAPNLNGVRKSAFTPYKSVQCTALTNLQRGNTQARVPELPQPDSSFHAKAGRGEISREDVKLEQYVDITDEHGLTALHWAASYGQLTSCQDLVWCGANVNMRGPEGETALHLAAAGGHHEVVKFLLNEGADADIQDDSGSTALMYAASADFPYTCNELLVRGADLTLTNDYDQDAYTLTTTNNCKLDLTYLCNTSLLPNHVLSWCSKDIIIVDCSITIHCRYTPSETIIDSVSQLNTQTLNVPRGVANGDRELFNWLPKQDVNVFHNTTRYVSANQLQIH